MSIWIPWAHLTANHDDAWNRKATHWAPILECFTGESSPRLFTVDESGLASTQKDEYIIYSISKLAIIQYEIYVGQTSLI